MSTSSGTRDPREWEFTHLFESADCMIPSILIKHLFSSWSRAASIRKMFHWATDEITDGIPLSMSVESYHESYQVLSVSGTEVVSTPCSKLYPFCTFLWLETEKDLDFIRRMSMAANNTAEVCPNGLLCELHCCVEESEYLRTSSPGGSCRLPDYTICKRRHCSKTVNTVLKPALFDIL